MINLATVAIAPVLIFAFYIFIRDKYEKEPIKLLVTGVIYGAIMTAPIVHTENLVILGIPNKGWLMETFYNSFMVASLVEEAFKYAVLFFLVWRNNNFNERFDGIVYGVFISLGFAAVENVLYVFNPELGGIRTGMMRAVFSVPGHGLFGVVMGYYFALIKYEPQLKWKYTFMAFFVPWFLHGVYDFILLSNFPYMMVVFVAFVVYMWRIGFRNMKSHIEKSPFKSRIKQLNE